MSYAKGPIVLKKPLFTGVNTRIEVRAYSDAAKKRQQDLGSSTVKVKIKDASLNTVTYTATITNATLGQGYITTTGASHTTAGDADIQVLVDDVPKERYKVTFVSSL